MHLEFCSSAVYFSADIQLVFEQDLLPLQTATLTGEQDHSDDEIYGSYIDLEVGKLDVLLDGEVLEIGWHLCCLLVVPDSAVWPFQL
jgi:hypothetical protein